MKTIKGTQKVWFPEGSSLTMADIKSKVESGDDQELISGLALSNLGMQTSGWTEIGAAQVEISFHPEQEVIEKLATGLRTQIQTVKAEAQNKVNQLEDKLNQLLALPNPDKGETP